MANATYHPPRNRTLPTLSYAAAMRLHLNGVPLSHCSASHFTEAVERLVDRATNPQALRDELAEHDYQFRTDVWHCLLVLTAHAVRIDGVFKAPE